MAGSIIRKHLNKDYEIIGVYTSATAYIAAINKTADFAANPTDYEGLIYYDKTLNQLRTYDGSSWSPAGMSGTSSGSLNAAATIGQKITIDGSTVSATIEIQTDDDGLSTGPTLLLDNDDVTNNPVQLQITNAGSGISIDIDGTSGDDIQGTADNWAIDYAGVGTFTRLILADNELVYFGNTAASPDVTLGWDTARLEFIPSTDDYQLVIGDGAPRMDLKLFGQDSNYVVLFDASGDILIFDAYDVQLKDDDVLNFGDDKDVSITWNQSNLVIEPLTQDAGQIRIGSTNAMDLSIYDNSAAKIALFDASTAIIELNGWDVNLQDDDILQFGDGNDITMTWDQSNFIVEGATADTSIKIGASTNLDLVIYGGTATNLITFDTDDSALECIFDNFDLRLKDDDYILLGNTAAAGSATDGTIRWDNTGEVIEIVGATLFEDNVQIGESGATNTLIVYGNTTLNGTLTYTGTGSAGTTIALEDDESFTFGDGLDVSIKWNASNLLIEAVADDTGAILIGSTNAMDFKWYDSDATDTFTLDAGASSATLLNMSLVFDDATDSFTIGPTASNALEIESTTTANRAINFGASTNTDLIFHGGTATYDCHWDASSNTLGFLDDAVLSFGNTAADPDIQILWNQSELTIDGKAGGEVIDIGPATNVDVKFNGGTATRDMVWDADENSLEFADSAILAFGTGDDLEFTATGTTATTTIKAGSTWLITDTDNSASKLAFGATGGSHGLDIEINSVTDGEDIQFNAASKTWIYDNIDVTLSDDDLLYFGDSSDIAIQWVGSSSVLDIDGAAANRNIRYGYGTNVDVTIYANTTNANVSFNTDDSAKLCTFEDFDLILMDDDVLKFGDASDVTIEWVGSSSELQVEMVAADKALTFGKSTNFDIVIYGDTSTDAVTFDTSAESCAFNGFNLTLKDDDLLHFGDTPDLSIQWVGSSSVLDIDGAAANRNIRYGYGTNVDVTIYANTTDANVSFNTDDSAKLVTFEDFDLRLMDDDILGLGDDGDVTFTWDQTDLHISGANANVGVRFGDPTNMDLIICGGTTSANVTFDTDDSAKLCIFEDFDLQLMDDDVLEFGDTSGGDVNIQWVAASSALQIEYGTANHFMWFGKSTNFDIIIYGDTSTDAITFDTDAEDCQFNGFDLTILDDDFINFGDADDVTVSWVGSSSELQVEMAAADKAITFGKSTNFDFIIYGDTSTDAVTFDTSAEMLTFNGFDITMNDADIIKFGDSGADGTITSDGTNIDFTITAKITFGDGGTTNYTQIDSTGDITQVGSANLSSFRYGIDSCGTSESYTLLATNSGKFYTTRGATDAVTFTLPTVAAGLNYKFGVLADQNMIIASNEGDNMVLPNDAAGDSVAYSTAGEKIGGTCEVICDGTSWFVFFTNFADGVADVTVTTAT